MTARVGLYEAKTHLSELGERAANGEEIVVTKHGKPKFRIVALEEPTRRPAPGTFAGRLSDAEKRSIDEYDWFAPDEEIERLFGMRE